MSSLILPYDIANNTPADAVPVEANYNVIADFINSQLINRDGRVAMEAPLLLKDNPTAPNHAANKAYIDSFMPVGIIMPFGGTAAPAGDWLLCDGSAKSTSTYAKLFNVVGYRYGGTGGNFNLPDMRGRFPIGQDPAQTEFDTTGKKGGSFTVPVPKHAHTMAHIHPINHDHAAFDSANNKTDHVHSIAHNHAAFNTSDAGAHNHDISYIQDLAHAGGDGARLANYDAAGLHTTTELEPVHHHSVDMPAFAGNSGVNTTDHVHSINIPAFVGNSGAVSTPNTGTTGTDAVELQPPFVVVNYIIRAA